MPRVRYLKNRNNDASVPSFEFQTRSDDNGPISIIQVMRDNGLSKPPSLVSVEAVKRYYAGNCDGVMLVPGYEQEIDGGTVKGIPLSSLIAEIMTNSVASKELLLQHYPYSTAMNYSIEKALAYGDILLLVSLAESNKTLVMLRQVYLRFFRFLKGIYDSIKRLSPSKAYAVLSEGWLEMRYGWRPLYYELENLAKLYHSAPDFPVKSTFGRDLFDNLSFTFESDQPISYGNDVIECSHTVTVRKIMHQVGFNYFNRSDSRNSHLSSQLGLDLQSLLQTSWELIPFSFILDMFVNIGSFLNTLNWRAEIQPFNGYVSTSYDVEITTTTGSRPSGVSAEGVPWRVDPYWTTQEGFREALGRWLTLVLASHKVYVDIDWPVRYGPYNTWFATYNVDSYEFNISPVVSYHTREVIDSSVHFHYNGISAPGGYHSESHVCFPEKRIYTVTKPDGSVIEEEHMVGVPIPSSVIEEVLGPESDFSAYASAIRSFFESRLDSYGGYVPEESPQGRLLSFEASCTMRNLPILFRVQPVSYGYNQPDELVSIGLSNRPRYISRDVDTSLYTKPIVGATYTYSGRFFERNLIDESDIDFSIVLDSDLSGGQITDLTIFGERLVSGIRRKLQ